MTASGLALDLRAVLTAYAPADSHQRQLRDRFLTHLDAHPDAVFRDGPPAHFTASVLVVDAVGPALSRVLLTHHRRAHLWLQFGGHIEATDTGVRDAAVREGREESGIADLRILRDLVELDRHELHGDFVRCTHHLDLRFVAVAPPDAEHVVSEESVDVRWWPADALPTPCGEDLPRLVGRVRALG